MAHIRKTQGQIFIDLKNLAVGHPLKELQNAFGVLLGIKGLHLHPARSLCLPVLPLRLHLLDVGTVDQHNGAEILRGVGCNNPPFKAPGIDPGQHAGMVDMGVGQKHVIDLIISHRKLCILIRIIPLLHTAVHQNLGLSYLQVMAASRYFMVRSDKGQLHVRSPLFLVVKRARRPF